MADALRTLLAGLSAGQIGTLNVNGDASGYGPNLVTHGPLGGNNLSQAAKCHWDPRPFRAYQDYRINGTVTAGNTSVNVDTGVEPIIPGMTLNIDNVDGTYSVISGIPAGGSGTVTFSPALTQNAVDNSIVSIVKRGERVYFWGHAHGAQSNSWPSVLCLEIYDNIWKQLEWYRHIEIIDPDPIQDALTYGCFHQDSRTAFNPAKEQFYRGHPGGNPTITNLIDCSEYNPLNIGKVTKFAVSGTLTFTPGSKTVTGGTAFLSELAAGYQIQLDGDEIVAGYNGLSKRVCTVFSVESNSSLTLVNNYTGSHAPGSATAWNTGYNSSVANPIGLRKHFRYEPGSDMFGPGPYHSIEIWPDTDKIFYLDPRTGAAAIWYKRTGAGSSDDYVKLFDTDDFNPIDNTGISCMLHYNTKRRSMLVAVAIRGVGNFSNGDGGCELWEMKLTDVTNPMTSAITITKLDSIPFPFYVAGPQGAIIAHCPISGEYLFLAQDYGVGSPDLPYKFASLNPDASLGSQITNLNSSVFQQMSGNIYGNICAYLVACVADTLGGIIFMGQDKVQVYKHTANTRATDGLKSSEKYAQGGTIGAVKPGVDLTLKYAWSDNLAAVYPPLVTAMAGETNYPIGLQRLTNEGNCIVTTWPASAGAPRTDGGDGIGKMTINTSNTYKNFPGSLDIPVKNQTGQSTGEFMVNIDGKHGHDNGSNDKQISPTMKAMASTLFWQYPINFDAVMLNSAWEAALPRNTYQHFPVSTDGVNSTDLNLLFAVAASPEWDNKKTYIDFVPAQNWKFGFFNTTQVLSSSKVRLNASPTNTGFQGFNGIAIFEPANNEPLQGCKIGILSGAPPGAAASTLTECAVIYYYTGTWAKCLAPYGQQGQQGFLQTRIGGPLTANNWHLITMEIAFKPSAKDFYTNAINSKILRSDSTTFPFALIDQYIFLDGYGDPALYGVDAYTWVTNLYKIDGPYYDSFTTLSGTVTMTKDSQAVTGVGTLFTSQLAPGDFIKLPAARWGHLAKIATIESNTALTLTAYNPSIPYSGPYQGDTNSATGTIKVASAATATGAMLFNQPTRTGTQGTKGQGYYSCGALGALTDLSKNRLRLWQDNSLISETNNMRVAFGQNINYAYGAIEGVTEYGFGFFSLSANANDRSVTYVHPDGHTLVGPIIFSSQPIVHDTALETGGGPGPDLSSRPYLSLLFGGL